MHKLSLVIPCYNEAQNLVALIARCKEVTSAINAEVIIVDNGSLDDSPEILQDLLADQAAVRTIRLEENRGYGFGILAGLQVAEGDVLAWTHADMQTDPMDAVTGFALFKAPQNQNWLFVKGQRYGRPFGDLIFTTGMAIFETILMRKGMWDINAQPTMFTRQFFETWKDPPHDFSLDLFAYYIARGSNIDVKRFPVNFAMRAHGSSHWNINWATKCKFILRTISYSIELRRRFIVTGSGSN